MTGPEECRSGWQPIEFIPMGNGNVFYFRLIFSPSK